ncbi:uncharacterized protein VTP21DRAFT_1069 [Calcarisporiella thermophila]|uniref:uncharacterized protein n=1 Tax=Calcarisporiella thermophila TaxID=911321 RepID=UPI0037434A11
MRVLFILAFLASASISLATPIKRQTPQRGAPTGNAHTIFTKVFVHENALSGQNPNQIKNIIASEFDSVINQAFTRDPSLGARRLSFTPEVEFITESQFPVRGAGSNQILRSFGELIRSRAVDLGRNDMAMIVARFREPIGGGGEVAGLSPVPGQLRKCAGLGLRDTVVINPGRGNNLIGDTATHELGHYFGAPHDGQGAAASCSQVGNIMSPVLNTGAGAGRGNGAGAWSSCSSQLIQRHIRLLESQNCFSS